jgi:ubiquinone/menaquinone biosynthesis C-methylase UbiE
MKPILDRKGIPFFHQKTALEFQQDIYERYHEMVIRQTALHLADEIWGKYPFQPVLDFAETPSANQEVSNILEIGCSVGRWIGTLAEQHPKATCWGIDYSYQMLKQANRFWVKREELSVDLSDKGFSELLIKGKQLDNLQFGLAKAEKLPFDENSQDLVLNSFLIDRLENPTAALEEMYRVLKPKGKLIVITPLNFQKTAHWETYFPPIQLANILKNIGFEILEWKEAIMIDEPLDFRGNVVRWKCLGFVVEKIL